MRSYCRTIGSLSLTTLSNCPLQILLATTKPGQFVMVRKNHDSTALLRRPFSVFETLFDNQEESCRLSQFLTNE